MPDKTQGRRYGRRLFVIVAVGVALFDQLTKLLVVQHLQLGLPQPLIRGFLSLTLAQNRGGAWGVMAGSHHVLTAIAALLIIGLLAFGVSRRPRSPWVNVALALLLGGALGNLADRLHLGYVVDFIDFSFWPTFNVADIAISTGATMVLLDAIRGGPAPAPCTPAKDEETV
ncbi:MAG: signal peptidase II [Armatimonadia bacterium]